jgi:hypothetical protein
MNTEPDWDEILKPPEPTEKKTIGRPRTIKGNAGNRIRQAPQEPEPAPKSRREGIIGLCQMIALPMVFGPPASKLDAASIMLIAPELGEAGSELAANDPRAAKIIDFVIQTGPYAGLAQTIVKLGLQIAANHKLIPTEPFKPYGILTEEEILSRIDALIPSFNGQTNNTSEPASV